MCWSFISDVKKDTSVMTWLRNSLLHTQPEEFRPSEDRSEV